MRDRSEASSDCSKQCDYIYEECRADSSPGAECQAGYNECMIECEVD